MKKACKRWSQKEKKILLNAMKNYGHSNIDKIAEVLPLKTKFQISRYLNEMKKIVSIKLMKKYYKTQHKLQKINQWISLLNLPDDTDSVLHKNLSAFLLLILEKYGVHFYSSAINFEAANFKSAFRFTFESLHNTLPSSVSTNDEVKALLFSAFNQLLEEIRWENNAVHNIFNTSVSRLVNQNKTPAESTVITDDGNIFAMFEINPFRWTNEEIVILCQKKL